MADSSNTVSSAASGRRIMPIRTPDDAEKTGKVADPRFSAQSFTALGRAVAALPGWSRRLRFVVGLATVGVAGARGAGSGGAVRPRTASIRTASIRTASIRTASQSTARRTAVIGTGHAARGRVIRLNRIVQEQDLFTAAAASPFGSGSTANRRLRRP